VNSIAVPGTILEVGKTGMLVKTGTQALRIGAIQMPNGKKMRVSDYILGHALEMGVVLK
jgi:methionyl-tRNA formyltransferase